MRHREAAERTVLTAIAAGASPAALADLLLAAETDRAFADGGHSLDFINKAFECLDLIGWEHAAAVLPTVVGQMVGRARRRGVDRLASAGRSRRPVPDDGVCELPDLFAAGRGAGRWSDHAALAHMLLGDDPAAIMDALKAAVRAGAAPADLGRALAYAAALRVARFGTANEHADWETAHHVFTYANAVHQSLKRIGTADRETATPRPCAAILHGAMALYLARYLNVPPARCPAKAATGWTTCPPMPRRSAAALLDAFDRQQQVDLAARLVARHLTLGHPPRALIATLARALLREDAGFHAYQMLEAGVRQFGEWGNSRPGPAHPHRRRALSRRPFADRAGRAADRRHRPPADARRRASSGSHRILIAQHRSRISSLRAWPDPELICWSTRRNDRLPARGVAARAGLGCFRKLDRTPRWGPRSCREEERPSARGHRLHATSMW